MKVTTLGKFFHLGDTPFRFRGLADGCARPGVTSLVHTPVLDDLKRVAAAGYTVVILAPPRQGLDAGVTGVTGGLRFILDLGQIDEDERLRASRRQERQVIRELAKRVRNSVQEWGGSDALIGVVFGVGGRRSRRGAPTCQRIADAIATAVHDADPAALVGWRSPWPLDTGCPPECDFQVVTLAPAEPEEMAASLIACHCAVGDRPLVLGSAVPSDACGDDRLDLGRLIDLTLRCGVAGTILSDRCPSASGDLSSTARVNRRTVRDLDIAWPSISVVINAHNAQATLEECLSHCDRLDYPRLDVVVVDDGSTDATTEIATAHRRVGLITIPHRGLSAGRNVGLALTHGELVAYLDADAYPSPEWPYYLALGALGERMGGSGGPNLPPPDDPPAARIVARAPGGPVPQLRTPDRAAHLPGCNVAFWRHVIEHLQGFDAILEGAEDVELEWRVVEAGYALGYHPAAFVWHHRRPGLAGYLRQQRHYGRSQAILERRHPERFPRAYRLRQALGRLRGRRVEGIAADAPPVRYLTLAYAESASLELAHQWGVPVATALVLTAPLAVVRRSLGAPAVVGAAVTAALAITDFHLAGVGRRRSDRTLSVRIRAVAYRLLRPLAFRWGHLSGRGEPVATFPPRPRAPAYTSPEDSRGG